ncbi:orotidine 5'-phosphate decarboxylase [Paenibacillus sp. MY03]|jgi:orotidine-5'-phosphate decarboxylase|uniref:Orotidine 5'-phosphate decarboxylase n=1 Tax=Paenibacillus agaridevorans TaxID=171404 RepID=A0A2R5ES28_9BACL|nr:MULTISPECIES: orotidine-5'-phosphate decarboxylase [Paenibacillus]OUS76867.1 orotidine 5'-phosphate decarboxylase [Paenibacillus sp. MY03]GBG06184.1 orotidine-5'-phosphate decarboxylase [Paenibacillus agaridevorans]
MKLTSEQAAKRIMVALDYPDAAAAERLIEELKGIPCYMKVGLQLFYAAGPSFVESLKKRGYYVFLDVKMHDIPNTVKGGASSVTKLGIDMFNVHAGGGTAMMEAAMEGVQAALPNGSTAPAVIAVTQLTSTSVSVMNEQIGIPGPVEESVIRYAKLARTAGLQGVVASPSEVVAIKSVCGGNFVTVTPGIRPAGSDVGDQSRIMTPGEALRQGTDYMVIGRPITASPEPRAAIESIIEELIAVD